MVHVSFQDQIEWFLQQSASIEPIERPFRPDTSQDDLWERDQIAPTTRRLAKPNAIMFFHIPLYVALPNDVGHSSRALDKNHMVRQTKTAVRVCHWTMGSKGLRTRDPRKRATACLKRDCSRRWRASIVLEVSFPRSRLSQTATVTVSCVVMAVVSADKWQLRKTAGASKTCGCALVVEGEYSLQHDGRMTDFSRRSYSAYGKIG